jgi:two-component system response regulator HydG
MRPRLIVVDDKLVMAEMLADRLTDHGFEATACGSGAAAIEVVRAGGIDLVITDLRMPDVDGFAVLAAVRAIAPEVRVIIMTAHGAIDSAVESLRKGADHYMTKPFKLEELVQSVERALANRG